MHLHTGYIMPASYRYTSKCRQAAIYSHYPNSLQWRTEVREGSPVWHSWENSVIMIYISIFLNELFSPRQSDRSVPTCNTHETD